MRHERFPESGAPRRRRIDPEEINVLYKADDTEPICQSMARRRSSISSPCMTILVSVLLRNPSVVGSE